ncbi:MAG TPA: hypothetical protein V6C85_04530 [Allocoleopsis sp.]
MNAIASSLLPTLEPRAIAFIPSRLIAIDMNQETGDASELFYTLFSRLQFCTGN